MDMNLSKLQEIVKDREGWRALVHGVAKNQTWRSDWRTSTAAEVTMFLNPHQMPSFWLKPFIVSCYYQKGIQALLLWIGVPGTLWTVPCTPLQPRPLLFSPCSLCSEAPGLVSVLGIQPTPLPSKPPHSLPTPTLWARVCCWIWRQSVHLEVYVPKTQEMTRPN